jgi:hypothetical protein
MLDRTPVLLDYSFFIGQWPVGCYVAIQETSNFQFCVPVAPWTVVALSGFCTLAVRFVPNMKM